MELPPHKTGTFSGEQRVKKNGDIQNLFKKGKRVSTDGAKLFFLFTGRSESRIAFTLPRGYGNAVCRNRCKRISREAYRALKADLKPGYDKVLLVYPGHNSFKELYAKIRYLCAKAGLFL